MGDAMTAHIGSEQHLHVAQNWEAVQSEVYRRWPQISAEDLELVQGDSRKLAALIHQKTGQSLDEIEDALDDLAAESGGLLSRLSDSAHQAADSAANYARAKAQNISQSGAHAYEAAEHAVVERPLSSVAVAFGVGFALGMCITSLLSSSSPPPPPPWYSTSRIPSWKDAKNRLHWQ